MRYSNSQGTELLEELLRNPLKFEEQGRAYQLLQEYFKGYPLDTLIPLLSSSDVLVTRAAIWIASELGDDATDLIDYIIPLTRFDDRYIKYHAIECIMVCSTDKYADEFIHVVCQLHDNDSVIRLLTMRLVANGINIQFKAALDKLGSDDPFSTIHMYGLKVLLEGNAIENKTVLQMIDDDRLLIKRYGAIASQRLFDKYPDLIKYAALSADPDLAAFANDFIAGLK
jgi:hypothetical protein